MYTEEIMRVGCVENGYVLEVMVPEKPEKGKGCCCPIDSYGSQKKYFFKTPEEIAKKIQTLLPLLAQAKKAMKDEEDTEDAFEDAFESALEEMK